MTGMTRASTIEPVGIPQMQLHPMWIGDNGPRCGRRAAGGAGVAGISMPTRTEMKVDEGISTPRRWIRIRVSAAIIAHQSVALIPLVAICPTPFNRYVTARPVRAANPNSDRNERRPETQAETQAET